MKVNTIDKMPVCMVGQRPFAMTLIQMSGEPSIAPATVGLCVHRSLILTILLVFRYLMIVSVSGCWHFWFVEGSF